MQSSHKDLLKNFVIAKQGSPGRFIVGFKNTTQIHDALTNLDGEFVAGTEIKCVNLEILRAIIGFLERPISIENLLQIEKSTKLHLNIVGLLYYQSFERSLQTTYLDKYNGVTFFQNNGKWVILMHHTKYYHSKNSERILMPILVEEVFMFGNRIKDRAFTAYGLIGEQYFHTYGIVCEDPLEGLQELELNYPAKRNLTTQSKAKARDTLCQIL